MIFYLLIFFPAISGLLNMSILSKSDDVIVCILFCIVAIKIFLRKRYLMYNMGLLLIIVIFFIISYIQGVPIKNLFLGSIFIFKPIIIFIYFRIQDYSKAEIKYFFDKFKKASYIVLILAIIDLIFYPDFRNMLGMSVKQDKTIFGINPVTSIFTTPNIYSFFMGYFSLYYYYEYYTNKGRNNIIKFVIFFLFTILSLRRKSLLGIIFVVIYSFTLGRRKKIGLKAYQKVIISAVIGLFLVVNFSNIKLFVNEYFNDNFYSDGRYNTRYLIMDVGLDIAKTKFPFGEGIGMYGGYASSIFYSDVYYKYNMSSLYGFSKEYNFYTGDNYFGHILGEVGYIGFIVFIGLLLLCILKLKRNENKYSLCVFAVFLIISSIIELFGLCLYEITLPSYMIFSVVGICYNIIDRGNTLILQIEESEDS